MIEKIPTYKGFRKPNEDIDAFYRKTAGILTPQEHFIMGSSVPTGLLITHEDFFCPVSYLRGELQIADMEELTEERLFRRYYCSYNLPDFNQFLAIELQPLDPLTFRTFNDPKVIGTYGPNNEQLVFHPATRLNEELRERYKNIKINIGGINYPIFKS